MKCRECKWMRPCGYSLYQCANEKSAMYLEYTGLCCEDDCPDGEPLIEQEDEQ